MTWIASRVPPALFLRSQIGSSAMALKAGFRQGDSWESAGELLQDLSRVERVDVRFGNEIIPEELTLKQLKK